MSQPLVLLVFLHSKPMLGFDLEKTGTQSRVFALSLLLKAEAAFFPSRILQCAFPDLSEEKQNTNVILKNLQTCILFIFAFFNSFIRSLF